MRCGNLGRLGSKVKLSWKLSGVKKLDNGEYSLTYETPEGLVSLRSRSVVMTVPSYVASSLLRPLSVCFFCSHWQIGTSFTFILHECLHPAYSILPELIVIFILGCKFM